MTDDELNSDFLTNALFAAAAYGDVAALKKSFSDVEALNPNNSHGLVEIALNVLEVAKQKNQPEAVVFLEELVKEQKLKFLAEKVAAVSLITQAGVPVETALANLRISGEEARLVTEITEAQRPIMQEMAKATAAFAEADAAGLARDVTLSLSRHGANKVLRAQLAEYGLKSEGPVATALSLGFNKRSNARKMDKFRQEDEKNKAAAGAVYNESLKNSFKDLAALYKTFQNRI